jgi:ribosome-binding protein aMBF1 (putative translation factor)
VKGGCKMFFLVNIEKAIQRSGLKRSFIAEKLDIKYDTFRRKLNGETEFKISELLQLAKLLNISITEVFTNGKES